MSDLSKSFFNYKISYCIGVHNEERILRKNIVKLDGLLKEILGAGRYEIIIVDNGSSDKTSQILQSIKTKTTHTVCISQKGYGSAFKKALEIAKYEHVVYSAIDLPFLVSDLKNALDCWGENDVIFGSKAHPQSQVNRGLKREITSFIYRGLLSVLFSNSVKDPQGSIFLKKSKIKPILKFVTATDSFFSTQLALYAQKYNLRVTEVPVVLETDSKDRVSRYNLVTDGFAMLIQVLGQALSFYNISTKRLGLLSIAIVTLSFASFSFTKGLHLYFWRDDWTAFWFLKSNLSFFFAEWVLPSRHPGEFIVTFPWFYIFGTNHILWQISGVFLKAAASASVAIISYTFFKEKKVAILSALLFASTFIGLEGFTWVSARLSGVLIFLYALTVYSFIKSSGIKALLIFGSFSFLTVFLEPGRSVFLIGLLLLYGLFSKKLSKNLFLIAILSCLLGLLTTQYGRSLIGIKSAELVSPYTQSILSMALERSSLEKFFIAISGIFTGKDSYGSRAWFFVLLGSVSTSFLFLTALFELIFIKKFRIGFFVGWIFLFFASGWISNPSELYLADSRYFTIAAVGFVILVSFLLSRLKNVGLLLAALYIAFSLVQSQKFITTQYSMRGDAISLPLLSQQQSEVPENFTHGAFILEGYNPVRGFVFDWSYAGGLPFSLARNLNNPQQVPVASSKEETLKMLCGQQKQKYYMDNYINIVPEKLTIEDVFSWKLDEKGVLQNTTKDTRAFLKEGVKSCL